MNSTLSKVRRRLNFDVYPEISPSMPLDLSTSRSIHLDLPATPSTSSDLPVTPPRIFSTPPSIPATPRKKIPTISRMAKRRRVANFLKSPKILESIEEEHQKNNSTKDSMRYCPETALSLWIHRKYTQDQIVKGLDFQKSYAKYLRENGHSDFPDIEKVFF